MEQPQHERGSVDINAGPQLGFGDAQALNEQTAAADIPLPDEGEVGLDPNSPPEGVDLSGRNQVDQGEPFKPANEDEELLYGPTERPNVHIGQDSSPRARRPNGLELVLPAISRAAAEPDAPQELHDFMQILSYHLGR